jgi:glucosyl-3-phosphoglycerate phosphatase
MHVFKLKRRTPFSELVVYSSDFRRTVETANGLCDNLVGHGCFGGQFSSVRPVLSPLLRERSFGQLNLKSDSLYASVWSADNDGSGKWGEWGREDLDVEPVQSVQERATLFVAKELEPRHQDALIILVSHGDLLQILQTAFERADPRSHRDLPHLSPCTFRHLVLKQK